jgi:hypothetical protein
VPGGKIVERLPRDFFGPLDDRHGRIDASRTTLFKAKRNRGQAKHRCENEFAPARFEDRHFLLSDRTQRDSPRRPHLIVAVLCVRRKDDRPVVVWRRRRLVMGELKRRRQATRSEKRGAATAMRVLLAEPFLIRSSDSDALDFDLPRRVGESTDDEGPRRLAMQRRDLNAPDAYCYCRPPSAIGPGGPAPMIRIAITAAFA